MHCRGSLRRHWAKHHASGEGPAGENGTSPTDTTSLAKPPAKPPVVVSAPPPSPPRHKDKSELVFKEDDEFLDISSGLQAKKPCNGNALRETESATDASHAFIRKRRTEEVVTDNALTTVLTDAVSMHRVHLPSDISVAMHSFRLDDEAYNTPVEMRSQPSTSQSLSRSPPLDAASPPASEGSSLHIPELIGVSEVFRPFAEEKPDTRLNARATKTATISADRKTLFLPPLAEVQAVGKYCDDLQNDALSYIVKEAKLQHEAALPSLISRVKKLSIPADTQAANPTTLKGVSTYTEEHLFRGLLWIRDEAPIIIHCPFEADGRIDKLLADTHFRNQFETKISRGTLDYDPVGSRAGWETRMFKSIYDKAEPFQRPKYGCLNTVNDPCGVSAATCYGNSYIVLKGCRLRTTFADRDSSCDSTRVASCEYHAHVLKNYTDRELQKLLDVANRFRLWHNSRDSSTYKEVQIHGEIRLDENIDLVVAASGVSDNPTMMAKLKEFCIKNHCNYSAATISPSEENHGVHDGDMWALAKASKPEGFLAPDPYARVPSFIVWEGEGEGAAPTVVDTRAAKKAKSKVKAKAAAAEGATPVAPAEEERRVGFTSSSFCMEDFFYGPSAAPPLDAPALAAARTKPGFTSSSFCMDEFFAYEGEPLPAVDPPVAADDTSETDSEDPSFDLFGDDDSDVPPPKPVPEREPESESESDGFPDLFDDDWVEKSEAKAAKYESKSEPKTAKCEPESDSESDGFPDLFDDDWVEKSEAKVAKFERKSESKTAKCEPESESESDGLPDLFGDDWEETAAKADVVKGPKAPSEASTDLPDLFGDDVDLFGDAESDPHVEGEAAGVTEAHCWWDCPACTYHNSLADKRCCMCGGENDAESKQRLAKSLSTSRVVSGSNYFVQAFTPPVFTAVNEEEVRAATPAVREPSDCQAPANPPDSLRGFVDDEDSWLSRAASAASASVSWLVAAVRGAVVSETVKAACGSGGHADIVTPLIRPRVPAPVVKGPPNSDKTDMLERWLQSSTSTLVYKSAEDKHEDSLRQRARLLKRLRMTLEAEETKTLAALHDNVAANIRKACSVVPPTEHQT